MRFFKFSLLGFVCLASIVHSAPTDFSDSDFQFEVDTFYPAPTEPIDEATGIQLDYEEQEPFLQELLFEQKNASAILEYVAQSSLYEHPSFRLAIAAYTGNMVQVKELLRQSDTDPTFSHNMALRLATAQNHTAIARELLKDPRVRPQDGIENIDYSAEYYAVVNNLVDLYRDFLDHPKHNSEVPTGGLVYAFTHGYDEMFDLMLNDERVCLIGQERSLMNHAIYHERFDVLKKFLDVSRVDHEEDTLSISNAVLVESVGVLKWFLEDGRLDPTAEGTRALKLARQKGYQEMVDLLLADERVAAYEENPRD